MRYLILSIAFVPELLGAGIHTEPIPRIVMGEPTIVSVGVQPDTSQIKCLATMVYGEARGEPELGQVAVAYTAINRATNSTVCDVVLAPKQYSIFNDNPALVAIAKNPRIDPKHAGQVDVESWKLAIKVARLVIRKKVQDPTQGATHYVAYESLTYIPNWTLVFKQTAQIGNHTFFTSN